ncbi:MAG TPA: NAD-dependent epimerase/dehydratase family protein [Solirubrobacteraceae bacterium]|nr:NAD-dependent epimerase/dehydratase family protein [Solirubrobacteraceae bacterium]
MGKRVLITGLSTYWGGRLAQSLEQDPDVDTIIGIDRRPPKVALERTEFVQVADAHSLIRRIVQAAEIDTVVDTRLVVDSTVTTPKRAHENNVIGTMNILAACSGDNSCVRRLIVKSSANFYGAEQDDPAFFTEGMQRPHPPRTRIERDIVEAEEAIQDFAHSQDKVKVSVFRFASVLGAGMNTSLTRVLSLPVVPTILGFDPRVQVLHEDDLVGILAHAVQNDLEGVFNGAADGVLSLGEVLDLLGKPAAPILPPWGTGLVASQLKRVGIEIPDELLALLRYGRGLDNRRLKATGYRFRFTSRETFQRFSQVLRVAPIAQGAGTGDTYRYEREVEEFLRYSPSVRTAAPAKRLQNTAPPERGQAPPEIEAESARS